MFAAEKAVNHPALTGIIKSFTIYDIISKMILGKGENCIAERNGWPLVSAG